jgi:hypothetical protein
VGTVFVILLALFLVRPQFGILQRRVAASLTAELGRAVEISSAHIRFLPRPGLELENLVIHNSVNFGAEPMVRSSDVNAWLRVSSLFRGRIEISSLNLNDASLNLSRNSDGKWNIEDLLERSSKSATAPTASGRREPRREFPYIEGDHARINFKNGVEKTHFALTNAEFSLWQDSEDKWGVRLRASPIRTDANLTDTGTISINGAWQRSPQIENTPVQISWEWKQAQIGQLSKLFTSIDHGWRGGLLIDGTFTGTLAKLHIQSNVSIDEFRRQDVLTDGNLRATAHCAAEYESAERALTNLDCNAPAGDGTLELKGSIRSPFPSYNLTLLAKDVSAEPALEFVRHINRSVPHDLRSAGVVNAMLSVSRNDASDVPQLKGNGEILGLRLSSASTGGELLLGTVPFHLATSKAQLPLFSTAFLGSPELQIGPFGVTLGRPAPVQAHFAITRSGFNGGIRGEAGVKRLQQVARILHAPLPEFSADGIASLELAVSHTWGDTTPAIIGSAQLRGIRAQVRGLNSPLQVHRADLAISPESVRVTNIDASARDTSWRGSLQLARPCSAPDSCALEFHLRSPQLSAAQLNQLLNPAAAKRPWYRLLALGTSDSFLSKANATGSITIDKLMLGRAVCTHFAADVALKNFRLSLTGVRGTLLDGTAAGAIKADFAVSPPSYSGMGSFDGVSLGTLVGLTNTQWASGSGSAHYEFTTSGSNFSDILSKADLKASFVIEDAVFPHVVLSENSDSLHVSSFSGEIALKNEELSFDNAKLLSDSGVYALSGTASLDGALKLKMTGENTSSYSLSGTLAETRVSPVANPPTQAELKP